MRYLATAITTLLLLAPASSSVEKLRDDHQPFLSDFEGSDGRVRLVVLLSPT